MSDEVKLTAPRVCELAYAVRNASGRNRYIVGGHEAGTTCSQWLKMMQAMCRGGLFTVDRYGDFTITEHGRAVLAAWRERHPTQSGA